jgi:hypothetical protein
VCVCVCVCSLIISAKSDTSTNHHPSSFLLPSSSFLLPLQMLGYRFTSSQSYLRTGNGKSATKPGCVRTSTTMNPSCVVPFIHPSYICIIVCTPVIHVYSTIYTPNTPNTPVNALYTPYTRPIYTPNAPYTHPILHHTVGTLARIRRRRHPLTGVLTA